MYTHTKPTMHGSYTQNVKIAKQQWCWLW